MENGDAAQQKPTSRSSRIINYLIACNVMLVWSIASWKSGTVAQMPMECVFLVVGAMLGRGFVELVQTVGPNLFKK